MIERLNQISLAKFIDLLCGDNSVLISPEDSSGEKELKECASKLIIEYKTIVDPSGMKSRVLEKESVLKENARILLLNVCQTLVSINCCTEVKEILSSMSYDVNESTDEQIKEKVENLLHYAIFDHKRNEKLRLNEQNGEVLTPKMIRDSFDSEIAFLMTYFKIMIDNNNINAAVYANIVHRADEDVKMKITKNT